MEGAASLRRLSDSVGVSISTIRRDVDFLTQRGYVQRTHGGALLQSTHLTTFEPDSDIAAETARDAKRRIGAAAAARIQPMQSVLFDSGTTTLAAARHAVSRGVRFTAVTNDLGIGRLLSGASDIRVVVLGGTVRPGSQTLLGQPGQDFVRSLHVDLAFIGAHAVSRTAISETSIELAEMKRAMIKAARQTLLLVDSSKFDDEAFCDIGPIALVDELITDSGLPPGIAAAYRDAGLAVTQVNGGGGNGEESERQGKAGGDGPGGALEEEGGRNSADGGSPDRRSADRRSADRRSGV